MTRAGNNRLFAVAFAVLMVTSMVTGAAVIPGTAAAAPGDVAHRVNAGGPTVAATDGGPDWAASDGTYVSGGTAYSNDVSVSTDASVPASTPTAAFQTELYGDQQWTFSENVQSGQAYEVRLYFAEIFHGVTNNDGEGARVFDVAVEGETVLDDYDIYADVGAATGVMKSFTVTPDDGQIDVDLSTVEDNAKVSAVEIVESEPEPNTLGGPSSVGFGDVVVGDTATETVTLTNLGGDGDADVTIGDVSVSGDGAFSTGGVSQTTLSPGESADVPVTFTPADAQPAAATLSVDHSGSNSPLSVDLSGEGTSTAEVGFGSSELQGFGQGALTALEFGPDGRLYVAQQNGDVYALEVERNGANDYSVVNEEQVGAIKDIPNHDDFGDYAPGENSRQITGLTVGGTADEPVVYVSSSDPTIDVGTDDDDTDTNSGAISRLTFDWNADGSLAGVDHDVLVLGLPRSEENHATNGLDLSDDGETLYVAQGGHTNQGAPSNNFGHTPEYALSAAVLEIDLAQIAQNYQAKDLENYDAQGSSQSYPSVDFLYAIPTVQNHDDTPGDDLPFGGNDGINQAKWLADGPVQVYSSGYRNPYDLVLSADDQLYVIDNGPNGGWGGQPVNEGSSGVCTNAPNEPGDSTGDQLHLATEGSYGGHPAPIRANPTGADIYDADGNVIFDINASNSPVPASAVNPVECDYQSPDEDNSLGDTFGWTGGIEEYTASNFGGAMQGDLLVVEGGSNVERVELNAAGDAVTNQEDNFFTPGSALGIEAAGDDGSFPGTVWTARGDLTVFEPNDYGSDGGDGGDGQQCTGADDPALDEDGDGYDNADEIDAGTDPCSAASTPSDFDDDGTSNLNDPDDDNDGQPDTADPFAVDPDDGTTTALPVQLDFAETQLFGENGQGWTGLMTNGEDDYQDLYDPDQLTVGGAAQVLTVEDVPAGDATNEDQQYAFQFGVDEPTEPFTVSTTVNGLPESPSNYQGMGIYVGNGDQDNYLKLITAANGGSGGIQFGKETGGTFQNVAQPDDSAVAGPSNNTELTMTVYPSNETVQASYTPEGGEQTAVGETTIPAAWLDGSDDAGLAIGVISTSYQAGSTFDATWTDLNVEYVTPPANQPPEADAGANQTVDAGDEVTLDASASTDPDGDDGALGYTWTQTAGTPTGLLDMSDSEQVSFTAPDVESETTFTFQVSVSDGEDSDADTVDVTVQPADGADPVELTVAEAVATGGDDDSVIENAEIQQALNWWSTGSDVPDTGGETIGNAQIQQLVNYWSTGATVGDANAQPTAAFTASPDSPTAGESVSFDASASGDADGSVASYEWDFGDGDTATGATPAHAYDAAGDYDVTLTVTDDDGATNTTTETISVSAAAAELGAASVTVTPDGGTEASTYSGGSFTVENTGDQAISSVSFDLSSAAMPDMVWDPQGTAGDQAAKGLSVDSQSGDGVGVVSTADDDVFSQPHNGQNADDGYDVLTVEFTDFDPGESVSFSADNDPTSIKGATLSSQEAGPVSGLELARSTVSVGYADGSSQETQLFGDGSAGGAQATLDDAIAPAPGIGVQNVTLDDGALRDHHAAATVSEATQNVTVTGEPGETVTLQHAEAELELSNVPEYDGTPGYGVEAYEANKVETVDYQTVTLDSNGEAEVPVTLVNTTAVGGYNYFVATRGEPGADTGLGSDAVVLKYEETAGGDPGQPADTVFAVNAGGDAYTAADGTTFQADANFDGGTTFATGNAGTPADPEIANTDDDELYHTERYGDFGYDVSLADGEYEVTLHFAELYQGVANDGGAGDRLFNVSIEGQQVLGDYDIYAEAGGAHAAATETFTAEVTDGELNVDFSTVEDNAKVSAIAVTQADSGSGGDGSSGGDDGSGGSGDDGDGSGDSGGDTGTASADFAVNANGGVDASTYGSGSFEITNTGDRQISSVTYDLSTAAFPDVVFDPQGTAGDDGAKGFTPDSGASAVDPSGSFAAPHNGQNADDGYDELVVDFGDFEGSETFAFSTDIDPTSIKNAQGTGAAGSVSGLELAGTTVIVEYADGSTQTTSLFGDGSSGGSQAAATANVSDAPTLGAQNVSLDGDALDARHGAATVSAADQTVTVSGPADATVEFLHVEGQLELANQADGYDLEAYEANTAENVEYQTITLDSNGEATVDVSLTNTSSSGAEGGFNYFVAAVQDGGGDTGETSNVVVLKYDESAGDDPQPAAVLHRVNAGGSTVAATDDGPDWTGVTGTESPYLAAADGGNYDGGDDVTPDSTVPASTPASVFDSERYGEMTWEFSVDSGQLVEVRLSLANSFPQTDQPGDRQFNASIEGQQVLTQYDPVADVGHATGTTKRFTVTEDGDGTISVVFEQGAAEEPEVRAIEVVESEGDSE
ncbi:malectin domain-containing carbohydrate-binding protein [Halorubrum sp. Atlit-26R]|uniref:malectin domain-containing carbohydrate-binding protein n=1 Tax=Halorubrum sp. Atlit-26R TaxID=2282128 RepID=UPI000EF24971|nr:malectin domain-containing carbohydrate-binding protein [Halorubrum sp. Atlit-26R]RLM64209.1 PKD domain-containing protein [Halorubrum sp. Atlit-26R]